MKTLLKNGNIVTDSVIKSNLLIEDGLIKAVTNETPDAEQVIDCTDQYIVPGLIDMHVHLREPGQEYKETVKSGAEAAIKGGVTTMCCMANTNPVVDNSFMVKWIIDRAQEANMADVFPYACVTKGLKGEELTEMGDILNAGACGFSDDGRSVLSAEVMRRALEYSRHFGSFVAAHSEDELLFNNGVMHEGAISAKIGMRGAPAEAETIMIARDIELARLTKGKLHVCHVSSRHSVELIRRAKECGLNITAEVTPNHLTMTDAICESYDTNTKINPPIRTEEDRLALIEGLKSGVLDCVASDHAPHHLDDKFKEYDLAAFGMLGLQFIVPLLIRLIDTKQISWVDFVRSTSANPAKILGLTDRGVLAAGMKADIAIISPDFEYVFDENINKSKSRNTIFWGKKLKGMATTVIKY